MSKFDNVESVKAKYEAGERVFTSHEVMVLLTRISFLENAAQHRMHQTAFGAGLFVGLAIGIVVSGLVVQLIGGG